MTVYLVRHAKAGERGAWEGDDRLRPLTKAGRRQAEGLVERLQPFGVQRIISSPHTRCVQTVEPLANRRRLRVEESDSLAEGAGLASLLGLLKELSGTDLVLCSHGDVIWELLDHLLDTSLIRNSPAFQKGSTWVLHEEQGDIKSARYLAPP